MAREAGRVEVVAITNADQLRNLHRHERACAVLGDDARLDGLVQRHDLPDTGAAVASVSF